MAIQKRFMLPDYCDCREVVMRELTGRDQIQIALWTDAKQSSVTKGNLAAEIDLERRESIRCSLVSVDGEPVNVAGVPFSAMDDWSSRTMRFLYEFHGDLNGVEPDDLKKALAEAEIVSPSPSQGASAPPTAA